MPKRIVYFLTALFAAVVISPLKAQDNKYLDYRKVMLVDNDSVKCRELIKRAVYLTDSVHDYDKALSLYKKADSILKKKNYPYLDLKLYYNQGFAYYMKGNYREADKLYVQALDMPVLRKQPEFRAKILNNAGANLYNMKVLKRAMTYYNEALEIYIQLRNNKGIAFVYWNMANIFIVAGDYERAIEFTNKANAVGLKNHITRDYDAVLGGQAHVASRSKNYKKAIVLLNRIIKAPFEKQVKLPESYIKAYLSLGRHYADVEKWDSSFYFLNRGKQLSDSLGFAYEMDGTYYFNMGYCYDYRGDSKKAIYFYKRSLKFRSSNTTTTNRFIYENMADLYMLEKQYDSALFYKDQAIMFADSLYASELKERIAFEDKRTELLEKNYQARIREAEQQHSLQQLEKKNYLLWGATFFLAVCVLLFFVYFRQYRLKIKKEHLQGELDFLKSQLNPHFLFNSINNIYVLLDEDKTKASAVLLRFSELMRYQLYECNVSLVPLNKELQFLGNYIEFEKLRYSNKLIVHDHINYVGTGRLMVAPLLLQPFIENAFKHTPKKKNMQSTIEIRTSLKGEEFLFEVVNTLSTEKTSELPGGIGLGNVKKRLKLLYHNKHDLKIVQTDALYTITLKLTLAHD